MSRSKLFDARFYLTENKLNTIPSLFALWHYLIIGYTKRFVPSPYFDLEYYYKQINLDGIERFEPVYHYISEGWKKGASPHPLFEPSRLTTGNKTWLGGQVNPLTLYLKKKSFEPSPSRFFDPRYYTQKYDDVVDSGYDPWSHFLYIGVSQLRAPSQLVEDWQKLSLFPKQSLFFDEKQRNPLLRALSSQCVRPLSDTMVLDPEYIQQRLQGEPISLDIFEWVQKMKETVKRPSSWFDPDYYSNRYDITGSAYDAVRHYIENGVFFGYYPNKEVETLPSKPVISILVPVYNVEAYYLNRCIRSVLFQSYPHWELCLADDASTQPHVKELLRTWAELDERIKVCFLEKNRGISGATNAAGKLATGDFYGFMDNDDELDAQALFSMVETICRTGGDFLYCDEELIDHNSQRVHVFHKPGINRELLFNHNYITHFVVVSSSLFQKIGGLDPDKDGAQDFDFLLKATEIAHTPVHLAKVLYKWRAIETSTTVNHESKSYADSAGKRAVEEALERQHISGLVSHAEWKFYYSVKRQIVVAPKIELICDFRWADDGDIDLKHILRLEEKYHLSVTAVVSKPPGEIADSVQIVTCAAGDKLPAVYNRIVSQSEAEYIFFLHGGLIPVSENWFDGLLEYCQFDRYGVVGGRIAPYREGEYKISLKPEMERKDSGYYTQYLLLSSVHLNGLQWSQEVQAVNFDYCMLRKDVFEQHGGFNEEYETIIYAGIELCFQLTAEGKKNIYSASAEMRESLNYSTNSGMDELLNRDRNLCKQKNCQQIRNNPYFNFNVLQDFGMNSDEFEQWLC